LFILLRREGEPSGVNRIHRLYREEGPSVRKRKARRRAVGTRAPILVEAKANARWSLDFVPRGKPGMIVSDNGIQFTSNAILAWSRDRKVEWHYIAPGKPMRDTAMPKASTEECPTNCSTKACSSALIMPEVPSLNGQRTTTISGLTHRSDTRPRQTMPGQSPQPAPTLRKMKASRFRRLLTPRYLPY
jgi:hypothetical protein